MDEDGNQPGSVRILFPSFLIPLGINRILNESNAFALIIWDILNLSTDIVCAFRIVIFGTCQCLCCMKCDGIIV